MPPPTSPRRLLLVEDEPSNIDALSAILRQEGYQISVATTGAKALGVLDRLRPDLILLDVLMPGELDGYETCKRIKAMPGLSEIPIIFLTALTDIVDVVRGFEVGAVDYVGKPFNPHELLARVRTHLALDQLHRENRALLLNVLPAPIAERLKSQSGVIADRYDDVSVLFTDLVGFTPLSARLQPEKLLEILNAIFCGFDELAGRYGVEKIKTIGDAYMAAGGLPLPHRDHLANLANMALAMPDIVKRVGEDIGGLSLRVGLHVGSVTAGVIGIQKFSYDIWGNTVNVASRLESHGVPGRVHVSEDVAQRLRGRFHFEPRGLTELKGREPMQTYFLAGPVG